MYFPVVYVVLYSLAIGLSVCVSCARRTSKRSGYSVGKKIDKLVYYLHRLKQFARKVHSGDTLPSQIFISAVFICNLVYTSLAIVRAYDTRRTRCFESIREHGELVVELLITPLLGLFFVVRLLASDNIVRFWTKLHTVVDMVTLPNIFIFLCLEQDWLVTKTLRIVWLTQLAVVLRFLPPLRSSQSAIEALRVILRLLALWLGAAGLIHMLETTGDPWKGFSNRQSYTYLEYAYFTIVTLSTVGYGDITAATDIGRAFMTFFIVAGIAYFAFFLPNLVNIVMDRYQHTRWKKFYFTRVAHHVIVCGPLTAGVVSDFLKQFLLHQDLENQKTHVLLLHTDQPDQKLRSVLRSHYYRVQYLIGSALNAEDLERAKLSECLEVFILARKQCESPEREDEENLLRLLSIKSAARKVPVTIQVLLSSSKMKVKDIPHTETDTVVCFSEIRLGLLARTCACSGLSTLVSNLFHTTREVRGEGENWRELYSQGVLQKIYCAHFSPAFNGLSFNAAARKCYEELGLVLIAVNDGLQRKMYVTPSECGYVRGGHTVRGYDTSAAEEPTMRGYFIGKSQADVDRVSRYTERERIGELMKALERVSTVSVPSAARFLLRRKSSKDEMMAVQDRDTKNGNDVQYVEPRDMEQCTANPRQNNHVIVCVIADGSSPPLNLSNFLEPIRQKSTLEAEFLPVTIVANRSYLEKEWGFVSHFPGVTVVVGSPLEWSVLSRASVQRCRTCVILTAQRNQATSDKVSTSDNGAILCSLTARNNLNPPPPIVTVLEDDFNAKFLDFDDERGGREIAHVHLTKPFACGELLAPSLFDSVTVSSFYCPGSIFVMDQIIGGRNSEHCPTKSTVHRKLLSDIDSTSNYNTFRELYLAMLVDHKTAIAISRPLSSGDGEMGRSRRYTVTAPPPETALLSTDHVLFLCDSINH